MTTRKRRKRPAHKTPPPQLDPVVRPSRPPPDFKPTTMNIDDDGPGGHPDPWADVDTVDAFYEAFMADVGDR